MNIKNWVKEDKIFAKIMYLISIVMITTLLFVGTIQSGAQSFSALQDENASLDKLIFNQKLEIKRLKEQLSHVDYISPEEAIKKCEKDKKLMLIYDKLILLDRGINHDYTKAAIFYISIFAKYYNLDLMVVISIAFIESRFTNVIGNGDFGIMQINYQTWSKEMGVSMPDLFDVKYNVELACQILSKYKDIYGDKYIKRYNGKGRGAIVYQNKVKKLAKYLRT